MSSLIFYDPLGMRIYADPLGIGVATPPAESLGDPAIEDINGSNRYTWSNDDGFVAYATEGCRTVLVRRSTRSLIEEIPTNGLQDSFDRTVAEGWGSSKNSGRWTVRTGVDADFSVDGDVGKMVIDSINSSKRIAISSYGYNYNEIAISTDLSIDQLPVGDTLYAAHMVAYQDINNHYLGVLSFDASGGYFDTFDRDTATGWGGSWTTAGGSAADYSTDDGPPSMGIHSLGAVNSSRRTSVPAGPDSEVLMSCEFTAKPTGGSVWAGVMLRYADISNYYIVRLRCNTGTGNGDLEFRKNVAGTTSTIGAVVDLGEIVNNGVVWWIRAKMVGNHLQARAWKDGDTEPTSWDIDTTDATFSSGTRAGCISITSPATSNGLPYLVRYHSFNSSTETETVSTRIALQKRVAGVTSSLANLTLTGTNYSVGDVMILKTRWEPGFLYAKAWRTDEDEPADWQVTAEDSEFSTGDVGLRGIINSSGILYPITINWEAYQVDATWANPPTITSNYRAFIAPAAVDSAGWEYSSDALETFIKSKLIGIDPDILDECFTFTKNQTRESLYGPDNSAGVRQEGADWNDFLGVVGTYSASGEMNDNPEVSEFGCMDCSGFARMILGIRFALPMSRAAQPDNEFIPRVTADQWASSMGLLIYESEDTSPDLDDPDIDLMPGDWLFWDATSDEEEEEGQIDHCGIYLGVDTDGKHRFISSRKTANGPTFSDIGGKSLIDSPGGLYTTTLRKIRRV